MIYRLHNINTVIDAVRVIKNKRKIVELYSGKKNDYTLTVN